MDVHLKEDYCYQMKMNREMFEGKDYPTQWALNPSMYQNMSNDQGRLNPSMYQNMSNDQGMLFYYNH